MLLRLFRELLQLLPGAVATTFAPIFGVGGVGGQKLERTLGVLTCECADIDSDGCELAGERVPDFAPAIARMQRIWIWRLPQRRWCQRALRRKTKAETKVKWRDGSQPNRHSLTISDIPHCGS